MRCLAVAQENLPVWSLVSVPKVGMEVGSRFEVDCLRPCKHRRKISVGEPRRKECEEAHGGDHDLSKPTCSTCREAVAIGAGKRPAVHCDQLLREAVYKEPAAGPAEKAGLSARDILRTKEDLYKSLKLSDPALSQDQLLDHMVAHPDLIQRPIVEKVTR